MLFFEIDQTLSSSFWGEYTVLWTNSRERSPFQAPELLRFFYEKFRNKVVAIRLFESQKLVASVILKKENGIYTFLSDLKSDANFFVFHRDCTDNHVDFFFAALFDLIKKQGWTVEFNRVPAWATYFQTFEQLGTKNNLFFQAINYSVCPVIDCDTPGEVRRRIDKSRTIRNAANRLKNKLNAKFEILTGDEDLSSWVQEFCNCHVKRWTTTSTPSAFRNTDRQAFLLKCLNAWSADKVLVRFAVKVNDQRIGLHICLVEGSSLIGHSLAFHPEFHKLSPAKVLLLNVAEWMSEKGLNILDFGNGNEKYKYSFSNGERVLKRIMISRRTNYSFIAKSKVIKLIRNNPYAYRLYKGIFKR